MVAIPFLVQVLICLIQYIAVPVLLKIYPREIGFILVVTTILTAVVVSILFSTKSLYWLRDNYRRLGHDGCIDMRNCFVDNDALHNPLD